jgi:hypothetical protein
LVKAQKERATGENSSRYTSSYGHLRHNLFLRGQISLKEKLK